MKLFVAALFTAISMASPQSDSGGTDNSKVKFPVDPKMTVNQAQAKCGNDARLSCCNKVIYTHDITTSSTSPPPAVVQAALAGGPGDDGLGNFSQCNDMINNVPVLNVVGGGVDRFANESCKVNIACCPKSSAQSDGQVVRNNEPCVALGSLP